MAKRIEKKFGKLRFDAHSNEWVISGTAPNISLFIKDVFRRISKVQTGEFRFKNDDLHCFELLWFMDRYPMAIETFDISRLKAGRKRYFEKEEIVETLFTPEFKAQQYAGLAEGCKLWEYQAQAVEMFRVVKRLLLGDDIGLGKTNTAIGCMLQPGMLPAAVVVQAHLPEQWEERIEDFSNLRVHVIKTVKPYELPEADVYIFSYTKLSGWSDVAATGFFKTVVLDEPQELRSGTGTDKGSAAKVFCDNAQAVLGLTATPVMNYGVEMWHVMQFICPGVLGTLDEFLREWCSNEKIVSDPDALGAYLRQNHNMLRRTEEDVDRELPRPNVTRHYCEYDEAKAKESEDLAYTLAIKATTGSFTERGKAYLELDALTRLQTGVAKAASVAEYVKILLDADLPVLLSGWHRECFAAGTKILMFDGSLKSVEEVVAGDLLLGPDSAPRTVKSLVRGRGNMFKVNPKKGEPWVCSENHILVLRNVEAKKEVKMTALQYFNLTERQKRKYVLFRSKQLSFVEKGNVFEPWLMGYWLGDGASKLSDLRVSTADAEVVRELEDIAQRYKLTIKSYVCKRGATHCKFYSFSSGRSGPYGRNPVLNEFKKLGLSNNKHIALSYKTASVESRLELLAGLLDSDGHVYKGNGVGTAEFVNKSEVLANDVAFLARSLGFAAYVKRTKTSTGYVSSLGNNYYRVTISGDINRIPTRIERKKAGIRNQIKNVLHVGFGLERLPEDNFYGFEVDGDNLFLLEDFTVVHNCYDIWLSELSGYDPVMYTGSETKARKKKSKEAFVKGDTNLMIISNRSGAGLDGLQFRCRDLVIGELDWSPMILKQLIGRLRRSGQSDIVNAHYMIANGGSDPLMVEVLGVKSSQAHGIMNPGVAPIAPIHDEDRMKKLAAMVIERRKLAAEAV